MFFEKSDVPENFCPKSPKINHVKLRLRIGDLKPQPAKGCTTSLFFQSPKILELRLRAILVPAWSKIGKMPKFFCKPGGRRAACSLRFLQPFATIPPKVAKRDGGHGTRRPAHPRLQDPNPSKKVTPPCTRKQHDVAGLFC